jgi:plasmid stabilization system protein ParE
MTYDVILFPKAQRDLDQVFQWMEKHTPSAVQLFDEQLVKALESLKNSPRRCGLAREDKYFSETLRQLLCGSYRLVFRITEDEVHILRIRHVAQKTLQPKSQDKKPRHP